MIKIEWEPIFSKLFNSILEILRFFLDEPFQLKTQSQENLLNGYPFSQVQTRAEIFPEIDLAMEVEETATRRTRVGQSPTAARMCQQKGWNR